MQRTDDVAAYGWLEDRAGKPIFAGVEAPGYAAYVRVFHSIYEPARRGQPADLAADSLWRPPQSRRVRWRELADRLDVAFTGTERDLRFLAASPKRALLDYVDPPPEGSLDGENLQRLVDLLLRHSGDVPVTAYYCVLAMAHWQGPAVFDGWLSEVPSLYEDAALRHPATPQNWWPADHSWLVYTDWDLSTTTICAPLTLVEPLLADPVLECSRVDESP